jgi:peptidoglycan/LPS O-acetylase OafA/YrhL
MIAVKYRPDIDGLRALAVVPVILFHAGASWLPGGFVGVDIFFVISGYLISSIILHEIKAGSFSFSKFYERRLRRIIPALLAMLFVTVVTFQLISLPNQAQSAAGSSIAALLSVSNFYFWQQSGYFAPTAEFLPLLHTWSLAVEEQFYLIFPIILLLVWRLRLPLERVILVGTLLAFAAGLWLSFNKPSVAYYLLPARVWELALGSIIASGMVPNSRGAFLREAVPTIGVVMIVFSLFWIRSDMIFPGWVALIPCVGAAMIIHSGGQSWISRYLLSSKPIVFVGLISYSLYLWHWPVLAALRVRTASVHLNLSIAFLAIATTFFLAWLSWRFVERPFRRKEDMPSGLMLKILGTGSAIILVISVISIVSSGFPDRITESVAAAMSASEDVDPLKGACRGMHEVVECRFGATNVAVTYAVIGDSHAAAMRPAIEVSNIMGKTAGTLFWFPACSFLDGAILEGDPEYARCDEFKAQVWDRIESDPNIKTVILSGRWPYQITGLLPEFGGSYRVWLIDQATISRSAEENIKVFRRSMIRTLDRLLSMGLKVIIVGSTPEPGFDVPTTVAMARNAAIDAPRGIPREAVERRAGLADELIESILVGRDNVQLISIWRTFCVDAWCLIDHEGIPIFYDDDHLSFSGATIVAAPEIAANNLR